MYIESDVFLIEGKEYMLRIKNQFDYCWMEPVLVRSKGSLATGGKNIILHYDELNKYEYIEWR